MPGLSDAELERTELLMSLALVQAELKPMQERTDELIGQRKTILKRLHELGTIPQDIHILSRVPLSTIYAISGRPIRPAEERKRE